MAGYSDPKPLIKIDGRPLISHVISLFPKDSDFLFICNENHLKETKLGSVIKATAANATIIGIPEHKLGPVFSIMQAKEHIRDNDSAMICYCDVRVHWNYSDFAKEMKVSGADAGFVAFKGFHPALVRSGLYATARIDRDNRLIEVREKFSFTENKMDSWTSSGIHYFKSGLIIKKYFGRLIDRKITCNNEYFVSLVHNLLIEDGLANILYPVDFFISWGKPEDVREYSFWSSYFNPQP